jgi:hypothetical protein
VVAKSHQEYRDRAEECERLAAVSTNDEVRRTLRYLAQRWWELAVQSEGGSVRTERYQPDDGAPKHSSE